MKFTTNYKDSEDAVKVSDLKIFDVFTWDGDRFIFLGNHVDFEEYVTIQILPDSGRILTFLGTEIVTVIGKVDEIKWSKV